MHLSPWYVVFFFIYIYILLKLILQIHYAMHTNVGAITIKKGQTTVHHQLTQQQQPRHNQWHSMTMTAPSPPTILPPICTLAHPCSSSLSHHHPLFTTTTCLSTITHFSTLPPVIHHHHHQPSQCITSDSPPLPTTSTCHHHDHMLAPPPSDALHHRHIITGLRHICVLSLTCFSFFLLSFNLLLQCTICFCT